MNSSNSNPSNRIWNVAMTIVAILGIRRVLTLLFKKQKKSPKQLSVLLPGTETSNTSAIIAHPNHRSEATLAHSHPQYPGVETCHDAFVFACKRYPKSNAVGKRKLLSKEGEELKFGEYEWLTFSQAKTKVDKFGNALKSVLGHKRGDKIGIYGPNCIEWITAWRALSSQAMVAVPLYDTLGFESSEHIIHLCEIQTVVSTVDHLEQIVKISKTVPALKNVILIDFPGKKSNLLSHKNKSGGFVEIEGLKTWWFEDFEALGSDKENYDPPKPTDLCVICFTSGTTGTPKGAMLSHRNLISDLAGAKTAGLDIDETDVHVSYLPLAHVFEMIVSVACTAAGTAIGFYSGDVLKLMDDIAVLRPTMFVSVPRLLNKLYDRVMTMVDQGGALKKKLFDHAMKTKLENLRDYGQINHALWDHIVFKKLRARLGGRVKLMVTGSAPLSETVMRFLRVGFSCQVLEGYGMTECAAAATCTHLDDFTDGHVGGPLSCGFVRLKDVPEMNYLHTDNPPRGEICFKGNHVFTGYYKDEERTNEALIDGWMHSGDVGMLLPSGAIKVIDRKKAIFKLSQGEYIAPEKIENILVRSDFVAQIFVYGSSLQSQIVAIIFPEKATVLHWAKENGEPEDYSALLKNEKLKKFIVEDLKKIGKGNKLNSLEIPAAIALAEEEFSVANELLTPTFKLKRPQAQKMYQSDIDQMYAKLAQNQKKD